MTKVFIVGGGTGGHVLPAIALADELVAEGLDPAEVLFIGAARGMEREAVPNAGYRIELLPGRGITRNVSLENVKSILGILRATARAFQIVRAERPRVIVGFGGYASVPGMIAGTLLRVPRIVHEQNAEPGWANRLAVRLGARPTVGFPVARWPDATIVGNPVRSAFMNAEHREEAPLEVLIVGGSLGARTLNNIGIALADVFAQRSDAKLTIVAGARDIDRVEAALANTTADVTALSFVDDLAERYARSAVVVARAGAITVSELACVGVPSVLIPLPGAPGDHQTANARWLADADGAECIAENEGAIERTVSHVLALLENPRRRQAMADAAKSLSNPGAAAALAEIVRSSGV